MFLFYGFVILAYCTILGLSLPTTYDQRQAGDVNVQVHVKDVQIVALVDSELVDDYTDYDYFYDYADFTIKPFPTKSTTAADTSVKPTEASSSSVTTDKNDSTDAATVSQVSTTDSSVLQDNDGKTEGNATGNSGTEKNEYSSTTVKSEVENRTEGTLEESTSASKNSASPILIKQEQRSRKRCRSGYTPDEKGRCRRVNRRVSFVPFAMKLVPRLLRDSGNSTKEKS